MVLGCPQIGLHRRVVMVRLSGRRDNRKEPNPSIAVIDPKVVEVNDA
jgi:peptide deformylase